MGVRINSYRPASIAPIQKVNETKKVDKGETLQEKTATHKTKAAKVVEKPKKVVKPGEERIDTYASYRKRKYAERIKTRFDLFI